LSTIGFNTFGSQTNGCRLLGSQIFEFYELLKNCFVPTLILRAEEKKLEFKNVGNLLASALVSPVFVPLC
jgi:hypothetical protein